MNSRNNKTMANYFYIMEINKLWIMAVLIVFLHDYPFALTIAL